MGWVHALGVPTTVNTPLLVTTILGGLMQDFGWGGGMSAVRVVGTLAGIGFAAYAAARAETGTKAITTAALGAASILLALSAPLAPRFKEPGCISG
jgi:hypothetical protein